MVAGSMASARVLKNGIAMSNSPEAAWRKYIEIAPTVRRQFLDATI